MIEKFLQYVKETYGQQLSIDKNRSESFEDLFKILIKETKTKNENKTVIQRK